MACDQATLDAINAAINAALLGPAKVSGDAGSVEQHSIQELIDADRYLASKCAAASTSARLGLRITKLIPGNCD